VNTALAPRQWLRRSLWIAGLLVVTAVVATVATFNANTVKPNLNFSMPQSVLLQIRADDKSGWLTVVIADRGKRWFIVPADSVVSNGVTVQTVASTAAALNLNQTSAALESLLSVDFDEVWQVDRLGLSAFVEAADGVVVTPHHDLKIAPTTAPDLNVLGGVAVRLTGLYASVYALDPTLTSDMARYSRLDAILTSLMSRLDAASLPTVLPAIGSASRSSMSQPEVISYIEKLQQLRTVSDPEVDVLPTLQATYNGQKYRYLLTEGRTLLIEAGVHERITP
jgi:hypothetical protein